MEIEFLKVRTGDGIPLDGVISGNHKKLLVNVHGTAGYFYEDYMKHLLGFLPQRGISVLSGNNRGAFAYQGWDPPRGSTVEYFEDSIMDIDAWISKALSLGYKELFLQGHSLGAEKCVYYMNKGKYRKSVRALILLGFADSFGTQMNFINTIGIDLISEAEKMVREKRMGEFISAKWFSHAGVLPKSADSYLHNFSQGSGLSEALPLRNGKRLKMFSKIKAPILAIIGDSDEYTVIPVKEAKRLMEKENPGSEIHIMKNSPHDFSTPGSKRKLGILVEKFIRIIPS